MQFTKSGGHRWPVVGQAARKSAAWRRFCVDVKTILGMAASKMHGFRRFLFLGREGRRVLPPCRSVCLTDNCPGKGSAAEKAVICAQEGRRTENGRPFLAASLTKAGTHTIRCLFFQSRRTETYFGFAG